MKGSIDATQPELSPRHRPIAQRAEQRHRGFLKTTRSNVRARTRHSVVSSDGTPPNGQSARIEIDPFVHPVPPS
jgi:hypothetical protein